MSTTATAVPPRWRTPSRWTLRARLVAVLVTLIAGVTLLIGAASVVALNRQLTRQLDEQLASATQRAQLPPPRHDSDDDGEAPEFFNNLGTGEGTLGVTVAGGRVTSAGVVGPQGSTLTLTPRQTSAVTTAPADGSRTSIDLGGSLGTYLVTALPSKDGAVTFVGLPRGPMQHTVTELARTVLLVGIMGVLLAVLAGLVIVRLALRPLRRVAATASRVAELPLDRGDVALHERVQDADTDPRTEVGQVGSALNRMLGHIAGALAVRTASEARMRRFVADASHELRTPLASIRGYAELTRRHSAELPAEVTHAIGRVESEAVRMTGLVEDLLLLARLDESADAAAIRRDEVDLSAIVIDCVSDAHLLDPQHRWQLDLPPEPVIVTGDAARLRQVLTNLLANARVHTPAGTTVGTRLVRDGDAVQLEVTDDGPGIPEQLQRSVFDRFARADSSRSRAVGSTGLGLAIVASVIEAHDGRVEVSSRPGRTSFTVSLPALAQTR
ncbi:MAG: ATP-binding protein [Kineosporiaceae bacterium]